MPKRSKPPTNRPFDVMAGIVLAVLILVFIVQCIHEIGEMP